MAESVLWLESDRLYVLQGEQGRLQEISNLEIADEQDPLTTVANAPLGSNPGKISIVLDHPDLLLRPMLQPPADDERIDRMVRFEAGGLLNSDEPFGVDWQKLPIGTDEDLRIGTLTCRSRLLDGLREALKNNGGGSLNQVIPPGIALYQAANAEPGGALETETEQEVVALIHLGAQHSIVTLVVNEAPILSRSHDGGYETMVAEIASARDLDVETTKKILSEVRGTPPAELLEAIERQVAGLANLVTQNLRMVSGQLRLEGLKLAKVLLSGKSLPQQQEVLAQRCRVPVRPLNPWAGRIVLASSSDLDQAAVLPSPWVPGLGSFDLDKPFLDAMRPVQEARKAFWRSKGALRVAVATAAALLLFTIANLFWQQQRASDGLDRLGTLVPAAEQADKRLAGTVRQIDAARLQMRFLHQQRALGRILNEFQNTLAGLIDPGTLPITVESIRLEMPAANVVRIHLIGSATYAGSKPSSEILNELKEFLPERYPPITQISEQTVGIGKGDSQPFNWIVTIPVHG
jgi:hypothetical protein